LFAPLILLFYFMLIRPQRNRARQHQTLLQTLRVGDEVETIAGIFGTIRRMDEDTVWVEISAGTTVKMSRGAIRRKVVEETEDAES
jgi:preprotein translocase subunit YajC